MPDGRDASAGNSLEAAGHFSVDARTLLTLGRDSIKDHTTALLELVKNSYDADADVVKITIRTGEPNSKRSFLKVADNGSGMTPQQIKNNWLRIGYSEKLADTLSEKRGRRRTGEKGIGRLSADRLGAVLELRTKAAKLDATGIRVNWDDFNKPNQDLVSVPIHLIDEPNFEIPLPRTPALKESANRRSGTELTCRKLRHAWTEADVEELYEELSILTPPFSKAQDFEIQLDTDVAPDLNGVVESKAARNATVELLADLDEDGSVNYTVKVQRANGSRSVQKKSLQWSQLIQKASRNRSLDLKISPSVGPVQAQLLFFPRKQQTLDGTGLNLRELKAFLNRNAGIRIYRDNIRVKPYGNPNEAEGDWLRLGDRKARDPAGAGRRTFKVAANQLVGAVFISRDKNPRLVDSSAREGLIKSRYFSELRSFVLGCVSLLETAYHDAFTEEQTSKATDNSASENVKTLRSTLKELALGLKKAQSSIPPSSVQYVKSSMEHIGAALNQIESTAKSIETLASQATVYRGLATVGIAASVFGHETQSSIAQFISSAQLATTVLKKDPPKTDRALTELEKARAHARKISMWGAFALARVARDKRRRTKLDVSKVLKEISEQMNPVFQASNITLETKLHPVSGKSFAMDIESIAINLLTNAYAACQFTSRQRKIRLELSEKKHNGRVGCEVMVSDSGPGVADEFKKRIWEPLFSLKQDSEGRQTGTGLGLAIIQSIVDDLKGFRDIDIDPSLKGARFRVWIPLP